MLDVLGGLVKHHQLRFPDHGAGQEHQLPLTEAEEGRIRTHIHRQSAADAGHAVPESHLVQCPPQLLVRQRAAEVKVGAKGVWKQRGVLGAQSDIIGIRIRIRISSFIHSFIR